MTTLGSINTGASVGLSFETLTDVASATIDVGTPTIRTDGYATAGDGGHGLYVRLNAAPSDPTNNGYIRSVDRYTSSGSTDVTHGGYWQLVPEGGVVRIEQFGGAADTTTGLDGTDNYPALIDAIAFRGWEYSSVIRYRPTIQLSAGKYRMSATIDLHDIVHIRGAGGGIENQGVGFPTQLHFPADTTCFILNQNNTSGETGTTTGLGVSSGSVLEGFSIHGSGTATDKFGILARTTPVLKDLGLYGIPGKAIHIRAAAGGGGALEGNANNWKIRDCYVHSCTGDALHILGNDTNGGSLVGFVTHNPIGGCGIKCESGYANTFTGMQITGYGNTGVHLAGERYVLISTVAGIGAATTPGTNNNIWYHHSTGGVSGIWPEWSGAGTYVVTLPIFDVATAGGSAGGGSSYENPYVELGGAAIIHALPPSVVRGASCGYTSTSGAEKFIASLTTGGLFTTMGGMGTYTAFTSPSTEYTRNGLQTWLRVGGGHEDEAFGTNGGLNLMTFRRLSDVDASWKFGFAGNDIRFRGPTGTFILGITTGSTAEQHGTGAADPYKLRLYQPVFVNPEDAGETGRIVYRSTVPSSGAWARGDIVFRTNPSAAGKIGWVCTTAGSPGTWKEWGVIDP
jgi:hypothetical protein